MNRRTGLSAAIVAGIVALAAPSTAEMLPGPFQARVVRVIDGDSLIVQVGLWFGQSVIEHIRIAGIDAPEMKGRCPSEIEAARAARQYLAGLLGGGTVELRDVRREKYGRALASVTAGGVDVGEALLREGLARPYDGKRRGGWC